MDQDINLISMLEGGYRAQIAVSIQRVSNFHSSNLMQ